ncbi:hypothetical protein ETR14_06805 [Sphingosinicella sp. BN140058]|nr:hypothetical protein ETR14_06805 [Sphingosinicella sp. BN140058]
MSLLLLAAAAPLTAQVRPVPGDGDPRLQVVDYKEGQIVLLEAIPGYQMMVELGSDEEIENVALGDGGAWQVTANHRGDRLFVKAVQAGVSTNLTVVTTARVYAMELAPLADPSLPMAYIVSFRFAEAAPAASAANGAPAVGQAAQAAADTAALPASSAEAR